MQLRQDHKEKVEAQLKKVMLTKDLPESVAASIREISAHYDKFLEVMDLDMAMGQQMDTIFKSDVDKYKQALNIDSSDEEENLGVQI